MALSPASPHKLLHTLLEYIGEQAKEIDPRAYRLSVSKGFVQNRDEIAGLPGVAFDARVEGDHIWMRVERLEAKKPPALRSDQQELVQITDDPDGKEPIINSGGVKRLAQRLFASSQSQHQQANSAALMAAAESEAESRAHAALGAYLPLWKNWCDGERPRRATIDLYGELFSLKQQIESEETAKPQELVWGIGVASWKLNTVSAGAEFHYPLLTQTMEIAVDDGSMAIELRPRAIDTRAELDAFIACNVQGAADVEKAIKAQLARQHDTPVSPFDASTYADLLKLAAGNLDSKGQYLRVLGTGTPVPSPEEHLIVTDDWVLFSRARSQNYLFEDLKRLQAKLSAGCDLPEGAAAIVTPPSDSPLNFETIRFRGISNSGGGSTHAAGGSPKELYFPLPYNEEQETIVQRLETSPGVCVQGPPGTGKTHTIANIICHYLATGRRVLVTSRGEPALEVLQQKIPEQIQPLTVALLTSDREGMRQFQNAIDTIQHQVSQLNPDLARLEIESSLSAINQAHEELARIDRRIDEIANAQLSNVVLDDVEMRAEALADLVVSGKAMHGWFDDALSLDSVQKPPLVEDEAGQLREARRALGQDLVYVNARTPSPDSLPDSKAIAELHEVLATIERIDSAVEDGELLRLRAQTTDVIKAARLLASDLDSAIQLAKQLEDVNQPWPLQLRARCRTPRYGTEVKALAALFSELTELMDARGAFLQQPVECPTEALDCPKTRDAIARGSEKGQPFGRLSFGNSDVKARVARIRVAGLPARTQAHWAHVGRYFELHEKVLSFLTRWNAFADTLAIPQLVGGVNELRNIELIAHSARQAYRLAVEFDVVLPGKAELVLENIPRDTFHGDASTLEGVRTQLLRHLTRAELADASLRLTDIEEKLGGTTGPISKRLQDFIDDVLGDPEMAPERAAGLYGELVGELRRVANLSQKLVVVRDYAKRIRDGGATKLAERIMSVPVAASGEDPVFPATWRAAWNWARVRGHLESIESREQLIQAARRRFDLEHTLMQLYRDMVAKAAWLATKKNASHKVLQALAGYATAIRRIGQGTGPNAIRYRRDARTSMMDAAGAVPCWIMSHNKISESMPADIGMFDLVIVDEASQSDLWALPAILRGKKMLIVGDQKQVSPDAGFMQAQVITQLKQRFLVNQPYQDDMTPEKSLYDLASRVFAATQVMLREHFRCVPPIIAYSNRKFYGNGIKPIRIAKASERIDPPLVDVYIEDGYRDKSDCNDAEAKWIAKEIEAILAEEAFNGRSLGVVSLLGMDQAKHVDTVVRRRCNAAELHRRRFECGDARTFQGSERDIMFLTMVVDPDQCRALSGLMFEQRFNVAASRARDRMYLVRSVKISDLSEKDLRLSLLDHFDKPIVADKEEAAELIDRCESGFEKRVFQALVEKGYRVVPQVKTGAYRIDMVVEGEADTRLAIECDGDEFHGPDRWQQDMLRQRVLERAGWQFWRCFASTWTLRPDEVLAELIIRLTALGIRPVGAIDKAPLLVEKRTWSSQVESRERLEIETVAVESKVGA